jgi:hypothetical protein
LVRFLSSKVVAFRFPTSTKSRHTSQLDFKVKPSLFIRKLKTALLNCKIMLLPLLLPMSQTVKPALLADQLIRFLDPPMLGSCIASTSTLPSLLPTPSLTTTKSVSPPIFFFKSIKLTDYSDLDCCELEC